MKNKGSGKKGQKKLWGIFPVSSKFDYKKFYFFFCRLLPAVILLTLFFLPVCTKSLTLGNFEQLPVLVFPFKLPVCYFILPSIILLIASVFTVFIKDSATNSFFKFAKSSVYVKPVLFVSAYFAFTLLFITQLVCLIYYANAERWFSLQPVISYITFFVTTILHITMTFTIIHQCRRMSPEYEEIRRIEKAESKKIKFSVKTKLLITMISTVAGILLIFMIIVLNVYHRYYTQAVSSIGRAQSERVNDTYDSAKAGNLVLQTYKELTQVNNYSETPFVRIDTITNPALKKSSGLFIETIDDFLEKGKIIVSYETPAETQKETSALSETEGTEQINQTNQINQANLENKSQPVKTVSIVKQEIDADGKNITSVLNICDYPEFSYSTEAGTGRIKDIPLEEKSISAEDALIYLQRYLNGTYKYPVMTKKYAKYICPVYFTFPEGRLLRGFTIVTYYKEQLMASYFNAKLLVFSLCFIFLYAAAIIAVFLADVIANPLLLLKTNLHKTSNTLSLILDGNSNISAADMEFTDSIKTKDEIKELSTEIKSFTKIVKGVIPYISYSTLKAAENTKKKPTTSRELCFLFTDIRGFTTLCEHKTPSEVVDILNHYLDIETEIILRNDGDIDKFVGDEMMAVFSGPKREINACKAAMEIKTAMRAQQEQALLEGGDYISMGIGINTGKVIFGSVGSRSRMDFTSIGDTVNLAARLEGANKAYGSKGIITEAVYVKLKDSFICRELDFITVKGKTEPCRIYELLQIKDSKKDQSKLFEIKELFEKGLQFYRKQKWEKAEEMFRLCNEKYVDQPSMVFLERISHFKQNPPPKKWDGVFNLKVK